MLNDLRSAFLRESSAVLPRTLWREARDGVSVEYPEESPVLGTLTVRFGWDEITVFVGPRGHHTHFGVDDSPAGMPSEQITGAARAALLFVRDVVEDRVSVRWGLLVLEVVHAMGTGSRLVGAYMIGGREIARLGRSGARRP